MNVLLFQLDGKLPNIALMRIAAHHSQRGDFVEFRITGKPRRMAWDEPDMVYGSAIFERSAASVADLCREFPGAIVGGTGSGSMRTLEEIGITTKVQDYSLYPRFQHSLGFTQRGCRLRCSFCVVPRKEGAVREERSVWEIWRGDPYPRNLILMDNDFFGQENWRARIAEIREGRFKVSFCQGINARFLTDETAEAIASIDYRDDQFTTKRIYTAWDNRKDEDRLFTGLERLTKAGVKPDHIMVYMLIGFWPGETDEDWEHRRRKLREFGARPYPMPYRRDALSVGFQRFVVGAYDKRYGWEQWKDAHCRPEKLNRDKQMFTLFPEVAL